MLDQMCASSIKAQPALGENHEAPSPGVRAPARRARGTNTGSGFQARVCTGKSLPPAPVPAARSPGPRGPRALCVMESAWSPGAARALGDKLRPEGWLLGAPGTPGPAFSLAAPSSHRMEGVRVCRAGGRAPLGDWLCVQWSRARCTSSGWHGWQAGSERPLAPGDSRPGLQRGPLWADTLPSGCLQPGLRPRCQRASCAISPDRTPGSPKGASVL